MKLSCIVWKSLHPSAKLGWKERAKTLNLRPIPGRISNYVGGQTFPIQMDAMSLDWQYVCSQFRNAIVKKGLGNRNNKKYKFGNETIHLIFQRYRTLYLNLLLKIRLFGPNFSHLQANEKVYETKNVRIVHLLSRKRLADVFTIEGLNAMEHSQNDLKYCANINISMLNDNNLLENVFVDKEDENHLICVRPCNKGLTHIRKPIFDNIRGQYIFF